MAEPVFDPSERVEPPTTLPAELTAKLQGKTAAQQTTLIVDYYKTREAAIIKQAKEAIRTQTPIDQPPNPPVNRVETVRTEVNNAELNGARATLIASAKQQASRDKKYWDRFLPQIEEIMKGMDPQFHVDFNYWETAYYNLVGMNKAKLDSEEREAEANAARILSERANAAPDPSTPPSPLPAVVVSKILPGLGITEAQYRTGEKNISEGKWPLTFDKAAR